MIDAHVHIGLETFLARPIPPEKLARPAFRDRMVNSLETQLERMDENGVDQAIVFGFPLEEIDREKSNHYVLDAAAQHPDRLIPFMLVGDDTEDWLARGAKGIHYYAWYPMSSGYESGGFGLIQLDGTITERAREAGAIAAAGNRHQKLLLGARPARAEVAVIYNPLAHFVGGRQRAAAYGGPQGEVAGIERDSLLGVHRALFPHNVPLDYVHINHLGGNRLRGYKLVIFPYPLMLPEAAAAELREYVRAGGALAAEARLGWNNERGYAAERIPGMGLWEVMGCRETAVETVAEGRAALHWTSSALPGLKPGAVLPGRWFQETLEPLGPEARAAATFADGGVAAVMSSYGKGRTLMLGSYLSAAYQSRPAPAGCIPNKPSCGRSPVVSAPSGKVSTSPLRVS